MAGATQGSVRVGFGTGVGRLVEDRGDLATIVDALEGHGIDSLWVSDVVGSHALDPVAALAFAAARTRRLRLGTSVLVAPGRPAAVLAKEFATLDVLSDGRFFPCLGLGTADPDALAVQGLPRALRGPVMDELVPLLRRIWAEDEVDHDGQFFRLPGYRPHLHPTRGRISLWLGGRARRELERAGRLGDGWLASFATADEVAKSVPLVRAAAAAAGRRIAPDHIGVLLPYSPAGVDKEARAFMEWRRPDVPAAHVLAEGPEQLATLLRAFVLAGASKFIVVPTARPESWEQLIADLARAVLPLESDLTALRATAAGASSTAEESA